MNSLHLYNFPNVVLKHLLHSVNLNLNIIVFNNTKGTWSNLSFHWASPASYTSYIVVNVYIRFF